MQNMRAVALESDIDHIAQALKIRHNRFRLMWLLGIETGLRISDLLSITAGMFSPLGEFSLTEKKTRKERFFRLSASLWHEIDQFRSIHHLKPDEFLFFSSASNKKKPVSRQWATRIIAQDAKLRGIFNIGAHSMRKVYACKLFLSTRNLKAVQAALNHRYPSTTLIYLSDLLPGVGQEANLKPLPDVPAADRQPPSKFSLVKKYALTIYNRFFAS
jgi:integrase